MLDESAPNFADMGVGPLCVKCGGLMEYMGTLGKLEWWRCVGCGWEAAEEEEG